MNGTTKRPGVTANVALVLGGAWLLGLGLYFIVLRPPLLPEDERFIGKSLQDASAALPGLVAWLGHVFDVLGGFAAALGGLVVWLVASGASTRVRRGAAVAGLAVCTWMAVTNFILQSDFRWVLAAALVPWLIALAALFTVFEAYGGEGFR
jgi:hypothetical protein